MRLPVCAFLILTASVALATEANPAEARREAKAREFLRKAHLPSITDAAKDLRFEGKLSGLAATRYSYRQLFRGIPVTSGILDIESGDDGVVRIIRDTTVPGLIVSLERPVSADAAQRTATSYLGITGTPAYDTELFVYPPDSENDHTRLIWIVDVTYDDDEKAINTSVWVDSKTGVVVKSYEGMKHSTEKPHADAATKTYPLYAAWMKSQFIGDDSDESIVEAGSKSQPWTMQDGCHGIFGNGGCPPTVDSVPGDSYYDCLGSATCKKRNLFTRNYQEYYSGVLRVPFGNYLHDNSDPSTAAADIFAALKWVRLFMVDYMSQPWIETKDAPTNVLVNENDPSTAAGGSGYNLYPLPPKQPTTYSIISQVGGAAPNGVPMTTGSAPDVVAHEVAHAVQYQQYLRFGGAVKGNEPLQEAQSDMFAAAFDFYFLNATNKPIKPWWIGEMECLTNYAGNQFTTPTVAIRYMDHPSLDGYLSGSQWVASPDCYSASVLSLPSHFASGPYNHMFYILATGDLSYACDQNVAAVGIGWDTAFQIWRQVIQTESPTDSYAQIRQRWTDAASVIFGVGSDVATAVNAACDAVLIP